MAIWKPYDGGRRARGPRSCKPSVTVSKNLGGLLFNRAAQELLKNNFVIIQYSDDSPKSKDIEFIPVLKGQENTECYTVSKGRVQCKGFPKFVGLEPGKYELLDYDDRLILLRR